MVPAVSGARDPIRTHARDHGQKMGLRTSGIGLSATLDARRTSPVPAMPRGCAPSPGRRTTTGTPPHCAVFSRTAVGMPSLAPKWCWTAPNLTPARRAISAAVVRANPTSTTLSLTALRIAARVSALRSAWERPLAVGTGNGIRRDESAILRDWMTFTLHTICKMY